MRFYLALAKITNFDLYKMGNGALLQVKFDCDMVKKRRSSCLLFK
jgi:hypothetical protein